MCKRVRAEAWQVSPALVVESNLVNKGSVATLLGTSGVAAVMTNLDPLSDRGAQQLPALCHVPGINEMCDKRNST